ncbi:ankyrin [Achlya hypogyna]|uniref:Ankyrin n=1 Tax=Achlya hypogyna TaxID=1202772 RepID=A0A1V9YEL6_ACHHY|nr:ankyrin [Achlya hypogyna]
MNVDAVPVAIAGGDESIFLGLDTWLVDARDGHMNTALHIAAASGRAVVLHALLTLPWPSVDIPNEYGCTPLHVAATEGNGEIVEMLLEFGAAINAASNASSGQTALFMAIDRCSIDAARRLLSRGADPNAATTSGKAPLFAAVSRWYKVNGLSTSALKLLLEYGADVLHQDDVGATVLTQAIDLKNSAAVAVLAPLVDVNALDGTNETYLRRGLQCPKIVAALLECGADANHIDADGFSILHDAVVVGNVDVVALLVPHVNDVRTYRYEGMSLLDLAVLHNHCAVARFLGRSFFETTILPTKAFFWQPCANGSRDTRDSQLRNLGLASPAAVNCAYNATELDYMRGLCSVLNEPRWWDSPLDAWTPRSPWPSLLASELCQLRDICVLPSGFVPNTALGASHVDGVAVADLNRLLARLETTAGLDNPSQVRRIVDPSMHCVVYGHTRYSTQPHEHRFGPAPQVASLDVAPELLLPQVSTTHQWLPTPVAYDAKRRTAAFLSYVGGIPLEHDALYRRLEAFVAMAAPMVEHAFSVAEPPVYHWARIVPAPNTGAPVLPTHVNDSFYNEFHAKERLQLPPEFQVIVEVQSYLVSPDRPTHPGQPLWIVGTGLANDGVFATAVLTIDASNVSLGRVDLRQAFTHVDDRTDVRQPCGEVFNNRVKIPTVQETGHLNLHSGRLAVIPSLLQHRLRPFHAVDASQPGHLTLLHIHFVHDLFEVLSTKYVFPQQQQAFAETIAPTRLAALPETLLRHVLDFVGWAFVDTAVTMATAAKSKRERDDSLAHFISDEEPPTKRAAT